MGTENAAFEPNGGGTQSAVKKIFWYALLFYGMLLFFIPVLCQPSLHTDTTHQLVLGREHIFGCYMFPGLATWFVQATGYLTGFAVWTPYLTGALLTMLSIWAVWRLGREYLPLRQATFAAAALGCYWYMNVGMTMKYNNNEPLLTFWLLAILALHFALKTGFKRWWIACGLALGAALASKYPGIILITAMTFYMFWERDARRHWRTVGPWLTILAAAIVFLPNFFYILDHRPELTAYIANRKVPGNLLSFVEAMFTGYLIQLLVLLPVPFVLLPLLGKKWRRRKAEKTGTFRDTFLPAMFILPILSQIVFQTISGVAFQRPAYGASLWPLVGALLLTLFVTEDSAEVGKKVWTRIAIVSLAMASYLIVQTGTIYLWNGNPSARFLDAALLARETDALWEKSFPDRAMQTSSAVGPEIWDRGYLEWNVAVYSKYKPTANAPHLGDWCSDDRVRREGGVVLWYNDMLSDTQEVSAVPKEVLERFPNAVFAGNISVPYHQRNPKVKPVPVGVALISPP